MSNFEKLLKKLLLGSSDNNINFDELCSLLLRLEFKVRIKGSHHIFYKDDIIEIINLQSDKGKAKPYQVKQVRNVLIKYKIVKDVDEI